MHLNNIKQRTHDLLKKYLMSPQGSFNGYAALALTPLVGLMLADLFAVPHIAVMALLSKCFHLLAIVSMLVILFFHVRAFGTLAIAILFAVIFKLLDTIPEFRFLYLIQLSILFAAAGFCLTTFSRSNAEKFIFVVLLASACLGFLQLLGIFDWVYLWSRHGYLGNGGSIPISPVVAIFRETYELSEINALQMRPSAIFASNQLFTGFILFASAIVLIYAGSRPWIFAFLLGACVAISAGKVVIFGVPLVAALTFWLLPSARLQAMRVVLSVLTCLVAYTFLFPGISAYMLSVRLFVSSLIIRFLDLVEGVFQLLSLQDYFKKFEAATLQYIDQHLSVVPSLSVSTGAAWAARADMRVEHYGGGSMSLFAEAFRNPFHTVFIIFLVVLIAWFCGKQPPNQQLRKDAVVLFALLLFAMIANVSASPLYWYLVGFGCYCAFARAFRTRV